ncbi:MAG: glycoside hydrolase family 3 protein [Maricaulaceae bacterium]|nr:glycoside hydrolase family 3 protein [Maricaulaceae bacterium]
MRVNRRELMASMAAGAMAAAAPGAGWAFDDDAPLARKIGRMLMLGFIGSAPDSAGADEIEGHLAEGRIGAVLFLRHNVRSREGAEGLAARFHAAAPGAWMAVDQEGGVVQRLSADLGYTRIPRAQHISEQMPPEQAAGLFAGAAREFRAAGFNMNLAPIADLHDADNSAIGGYGRSFGDDPERVAGYARAFIEAFEAEGAACAIKHFPGHGFSRGDSHDGFVDITETWQAVEAGPFQRLIDSGHAGLIMTGHLTHLELDSTGAPATFSRAMVTHYLRGKLGHDGAVITDDLDMGAIRENYSRREAVLRAIEAGCDLIMMSNSAAPDPQLPQNAVRWVMQAIEEGRIEEGRIHRSFARLAALRERVNGQV